MNLVKSNKEEYDSPEQEAYDGHELRFVTRKTVGINFFFFGLVLASGLVIATKYQLLGASVAIFGLAKLTYKEENRINVYERRYKKVTSILGFAFGTWEDLPNEKFLLLKKLSDASNWSSILGNFTYRAAYYKIFLKSRDQYISLELLTENDEEKAMKSAQELASLFSADLKVDIGRKR